jgi:hypothetical protein
MLILALNLFDQGRVNVIVLEEVVGVVHQLLLEIELSAILCLVPNVVHFGNPISGDTPLLSIRNVKSILDDVILVDFHVRTTLTIDDTSHLSSNRNTIFDSDNHKTLLLSVVIPTRRILALLVPPKKGKAKSRKNYEETEVEDGASPKRSTDLPPRDVYLVQQLEDKKPNESPESKDSHTNSFPKLYYSVYKYASRNAMLIYLC